MTTMKTAKMPAKKTERKVVVHHDNYGATACGVDTYHWSHKEVKTKLRKGWGGVTCERCLYSKKLADDKRKAAKAKKTPETPNRRVASSIW
jgi:hypothetical protein